MTHKAIFSKEIITAFEMMIDPEYPQHDPFGGTGERLGALADSMGFVLTGTEIEASFIVDPRIKHGDATDPTTYPTVPYHIVTSPAYPNGMADHWCAQDDSKRNTYRAWIKEIEGADRELHPNNMGRYGYRGTGPQSRKRQEYWKLAIDTVHCWAGCERALVNVSDFIWSKDGHEVREPVVAGWKLVLEQEGFRTVRVHHVKTQRNGYGENGAVRVESEAILDVRRYPDHAD